MENDTKAIKVDVEEIMRKIKENVEKRRADVPRTTTLRTPKPESIDLAYIRNNWYIHNNDYKISSHRKVTGPALVKGRELVHGEVKRYMDPIVYRQSEFNSHVAAAIENINMQSIEGAERINRETASAVESLAGDMKSRMAEEAAKVVSETEAGIAKLKAETDDRIEKLKTETDASINDRIEKLRTETDASINDRIEKFRAEVSSIVDRRIKGALSDMNKDIENKAWLAGLLEDGIKKQYAAANYQEMADNTDGVNYFIFEDRFRGPMQEIKQRQAAFQGYFQNCRNVLDIGCGRGEFLELMNENGVTARGIDIDSHMVEYCKSRGFDVEKVDALSYLERIEDDCLDGIFIDQVVEHLPPEYLVQMLKLCHKKLKLGYYILIETVNPLSLASFMNFYIDLTHKRPIHPETLRFLISMAGFREIDLRFSSPVPEEHRLKKIDGDRDKNAVAIYNKNIDRLNEILFGAQDYAVIGKK